jgi:signal transduction histidine kinase
MKILLLFLIIVSSFKVAYAQQTNRDSLLVLLSKAKPDTTRVNLLLQLGGSYDKTNLDSMFLFRSEGLKLALQINYKKGEIAGKDMLANYSWLVGDYATAVKFYLDIAEFYKPQKDTLQVMLAYSGLINSYRDQGDYKEALHYCFLSIDLSHQFFKPARRITNAMTGSVYYEMNKYDSALYYLNKAVFYPDELRHSGWISLITGRTHAKLKNTHTAFTYYRQSIKELAEVNNMKDLAGANISVGELYEETGHTDSAIYYGKQALNIALPMKYNKEKMQSYFLLSKAYEKISPENALAYYKFAMATKDSLYNQEKQRQILSYKFNEELRQNEIKNAEQQIKNRNNIFMLLSVLVCALLFVVFLIRNNKHKQKLNTLLQHQKEELQSTLEHLKATQSQLIQSEKMASLGELTAGIAHEIQNPLNFVNNFSEVSQELVDELQQELEAGDTTEAKALTEDIKQNLSKIHHHGKRADSIVKNMLQHSRSSAGERQLTDINALADEYLRLAYHGLRAKDKEFNADFKLEADPTVGKVEVVPQEIGRVLLNLFNNAFYAVSQKKAQLNGQYQPQVRVTTKALAEKVEIRVKDNGTGIPESIKSKIFQPFFTTKPTGEGTGLGLSLSYDIITKGHGGQFEVQSKEGQYTEFTIKLPAN